jgi:hypothetical protein
MTMPPVWLLAAVLAACGSFLPGPCSYAPDPRFDCSLGVPCPENFACVPADPRGNFDCRSGQACVDGACVEGGGDVAAGRPCDAAAECEGGLCVQGRCSRPCDFGCPRGFVCDDDAIPGGLCVPLPDDGCR